jgi:hypothetical protein
VSGVAIILGSGGSAVSEFDAALSLCPQAKVICVNDALRFCGVRADAFATLHPEKGERFLKGLDIEGLPLYASEVNANSRYPWIIIREQWAGTSGLFGVQIALNELRFERVILAGVPMDHAAGTIYKLHPRYRGKWANGYEDRYRRGWEKALPRLSGKVKSLSGWTRDLLGEPSKDWLSPLSAAR